MDIDILDSLEDLGYSGSVIDDTALKKAIELGPKSVEFTELIEWISKELQTLCDLEGCVNAITDPEESSSFLLELSSFLKEIDCPYDDLTEGPVSQRLLTEQNRITLLDFLCTELQAARINIRKSEKKKQSLEIEMESSSTANSLNSFIKVLDINSDINENLEEFFSEAESKIEKLLPELPEIYRKPILEETLSPEQWAALQTIQSDMNAEYRIRREMLLTRLDVTVQSFKWGENSKGKEEEISKTFLSRRIKLKAEPDVDISDVSAAHEGITLLEKTSSADLVKNTKSKLNSILIGHVPDRGGRPKEQRPPVEMPGWKKRSQPQGKDNFRGGRGGGGGGGKKFRGKGSGRPRQGAFDAAGSY